MKEPVNPTVPIGHLFLFLQEGWALEAYMIAWAIRAVENGSNSPSIIELAGYTSPVNSFELKETLRALCAEFSITFDDPASCIVYFINEVSADSNVESVEAIISEIRAALYFWDSKY